MRKFIAGLVVGGVLGGACTVLDALGSYTVYGVGSQTCGAWVQDINKRPDNYIFHAWVAGFVSGVGSMGESLKETQAAAMELFVTNYCNAHPLDDVADASAALVMALKQR